MMRRSALSLLVILTTLLPRGAKPEEQGSLALSRDALWRGLFARPVSSKPAEAGTVEAEKVTLGELLFHDVRLSGDGTRSCASCHGSQRAFTDGLARARGRDGQFLRRNTPTLYNVAWGKSFYWDGRAPSLEAQARVPLTATNELGGSFPLMVERLEADTDMAARFRRAFPHEPRIREQTIVEAIAAYERTLVVPETRFDRWIAGDDKALSAAEQDGFAIFVGKGGCVACHRSWRFTDDDFHDIGLPGDDPGRGAVEGGVPGLAQFKTPGLRELTRTAPYMHDGSLSTLNAVIAHYAGGLVARPSLDTNVVRNLALDEAERRSLVAFLLSLSSD